jgi:uncharacterized protein
MQLYTGPVVDVLQLQAMDIDIRDIAHALAQLNRFGGHGRKSVSVAQHSVYVSRLSGRKHALQGLLHDASEAYLGDVPSPLKQSELFSSYRVVERRLQQMIFARFNCSVQEAPQVVAADALMLRFEAWQVFKHPTWCVAPSREERGRIGAWEVWSWEVAEDLFLRRFRELAVKESA